MDIEYRVKLTDHVYGNVDMKSEMMKAPFLFEPSIMINRVTPLRIKTWHISIRHLRYKT